LGFLREGAEDGARRNGPEPGVHRARDGADGAGSGKPRGPYAYQNTSAIVGQLGTDFVDFDTSSAAAREKLVYLGCPAGKERGMFVNPTIMRALKKSAVGYFNPVNDIAKQFRTGIVGSGDGFDWYESVSLYPRSRSPRH
jgi:hypothetical protein